MGIQRVDAERCTGCGVCVDICPMDVLRMDEKRNIAAIRYVRDCQSCFLCEVECPEDAITCIARYERRVPSAWWQ